MTLAIGLSLPDAAAAADMRRTVQLDFGGQKIEGTPLTNSSAGVELLGRDGRLWTVPAKEAGSLKQTSSSFHSYPASVLKGQLQSELGKGFRVVSTGHYLVAYPEKVPRELGRTVRRVVSLVCPVLLCARLSLAGARVSSGRDRLARSAEF